MKKVLKRILIIIIVAILLVAAVILVSIFPMFSMTPAATGEIPGTNIFAVNNSLNALYFIDTDEGYIVVDAGSDTKAVAQTLTETGIAPSDVKYVLLTHSDYDHVASLPLFGNAQIYMCEDEMQVLDGTTKRNFYSSNSLPDDILLGNITLLEDGQDLELGGHSVECIKVPGHTTGSMAYLLDGQYLFTGDALKVADGEMDIHPFTMDKETAKNSIDRINEIKNESELMLTAHYGYYMPNELNWDVR